MALIDRLHTLPSSPEWWEAWDLVLSSRYAPLVSLTYLGFLIEESIKQNITNTLALALRHPCFRHNEIQLIKNIIRNPIPLEEATVLTLIGRLHALRTSPGCLEGWEVLLNSKYVHFVSLAQWSFLFEESIKQNNPNVLTLVLDSPGFEHHRPFIWFKIIENICKENFEQARTVEGCFYRYYPRAYWALKVCLFIPTMILSKTVRLTSRFLIWLYKRYIKRT